MSKKLRITCDLDNILNDLTVKLLEMYNKDSGDNLTINDITQYKIDSFTLPDYKITDYFQSPALWMRVEPLYQSQQYLHLLNDDYDLRIVSASHLGDMPVKYRWIKTYFPFLKREQIWTVFNKDWIESDIHIDDCTDNLINGSYSKILLDYPFNRHIDDCESDIIRCYNWREIFEAIREIEKLDTNFNKIKEVIGKYDYQI